MNRLYTRICIVTVCIIGLTLSARPLSEIKKSGELKAAMRVREGVLDKSLTSGFHYDIINAFCQAQGVKLKIVVKENLSDYFSGKIFNECDVVVDNITVLPDRQKHMEFVEIIPIKQILVTKQDHAPIASMAAITKDTIVVAKDSSYYENIKIKEKEAAAIFKYHFSSSTATQIDDLLAGKGTVTILDANLAAQKLTDAKLMLHRAISGKQSIAWGHSAKDKDLGKALLEYIQKIKTDGTLGKIWDKHIEGIDFQSYLKIAQ